MSVLSICFPCIVMYSERAGKRKKAFRLRREVKAYPQLGRSFELGEIGIDSRAFWLVLEF